PLDFLTPSDQPGILGTLGRYQVLEVIGRGAMGIVLKALDPDLLRPVAVKVLAPYLAPSGTARERFKREARAAAAVSHDHVVTIHAVEEANGLPFFVMEYVTGVSLQGRLDRDGPLPPRDIARIGMQAANGLAAAHEQGLVHRDIKPANILLENGVERVKLTDFGLARAADDARLTQSGVTAGTPLYMSPEQARGEAVDARSDLFSLGSVLYTLATGFPPFRAGSAMGVLHRIINDPPRRIRETIPDFPPDLEAIIMQLLEKDPAKRFQLGADVSFRLTAFLAGPHREAAAPAESEARDGPATEKTNPWVLALCLLAAAAVVAVVLTFRTPYGMLVVEVNDPGVKVALDGNELTITGAGTQEVRLKPGAYHVTATDKDGKPAKVSQEVVTIKKDGKAIVTVRVEPAAGLPSPVPRMTAADTDVLQSANPLRTTPSKDAPKKMDPEWEAKLDPLMKQFQDLTRRLAGTPAGGRMLLPGPVADLDKAVAGVRESDRDKVKRLLSLRDQFALLIPRAQAAAVRLHELKDLVASSYRTSVRQSLEEMHTGLVGFLRDMERIATDLGAKPYRPDAVPSASGPEAEFKTVLAEYDALVLRLTRHRVGRVVTVVARQWNPGTLEGRGITGPDQEKAVNLLNLRDEVLTQKEKAEGVLRQIDQNRQRLAEFAAKKADPSAIAEVEETMRQEQAGLRVFTETIRGLVADLAKLADEIDPPAKTGPGDLKIDPRFQKVRELKEKIERIDRAQRNIAQAREILAEAEKNLQDLEAKRKAATDPKVAEDLDLQLATVRRDVGDYTDKITEGKAELARVGPAEPLQKELDQLRKEIADSLENKTPARGKD
ncbi:MAG TPA: protein kinase, partial [Gemmataceae bacterium]|nr:protein kinase [Gemmataceae bacterium]